MDALEYPRLHSGAADVHGAIMRSYLAGLIREFPAKVLLTLALMALTGLLECAGLLLMVPLLMLVGVELGQGTASRIAETSAAVFEWFSVPPTLAVVLVFYMAVVVSRATLQLCQSIAMSDLQSSSIRSLRHRLFRAILQTQWSYFSRSRPSSFLHVLTAEVTRVGAATDHLLPLVWQLLMVAVYLLFALTVSPVITLLVISAGLGLLLLLRPQARRAFATGERMTAATASMYAAVSEQLSGFKTARSYRAERRTAEAFDGLQREIVATQRAAQQNFARVKLGFEIGAVVLMGLMVFASLEIFALSLAEALLLMYVFGRVIPRLGAMQQSFQYFINALPAFRNVTQAILNCEAEAEPHCQESTARVELNEKLRLHRVWFSYRPDSATPLVQDLDLTIPAHLTTAIVGPSGAGKTTIADLIMGLISPDHGCLLVDGVPLTPELLGAWRDQIGYVPQDTFLIHDTIRANLLWARPGASEAELLRALRFASAERFVNRLPRGLDSVVGDRGVLLSGGERQRLALARALLRRPALLILDEATSSLDSENERHIQRAIEHLHGRVTILVITHRLSTIREADLIHVIEDGRLRESGTWAELIEAKGRFIDLCRAQRITIESTPETPIHMAATGTR